MAGGQPGSDTWGRGTELPPLRFYSGRAGAEEERPLERSLQTAGSALLAEGVARGRAAITCSRRREDGGWQGGGGGRTRRPASGAKCILGSTCGPVCKLFAQMLLLGEACGRRSVYVGQLNNFFFFELHHFR